jgi:hypothetical protein
VLRVALLTYTIAIFGAMLLKASIGLPEYMSRGFRLYLTDGEVSGGCVSKSSVVGVVVHVSFNSTPAQTEGRKASASYTLVSSMHGLEILGPETRGVAGRRNWLLICLASSTMMTDHGHTTPCRQAR